MTFIKKSMAPLHKLLLASSLLALTSGSVFAKKDDPTPTWTDPIKAEQEHAGFKYLGEYSNGKQGIQVSPEKDLFFVAIYQGGLPNQGWNGKKVSYQRLQLAQLQQTLSGFKKVDRGVKVGSYSAPEGATIIFDGKKSKALKGGGKIIDNLLMVGASTKDQYQDFHLHAEFRTPYKPERDIGHPDRGNSGFYLLSRYEIQVMDCFAWPYSKKAWKEQITLTRMKDASSCNGAIYKTKTPDINMNLPPLTWQSYDIDFTAARFDGKKKIKNARITVFQNGVKIHDDVELLKGTGNQGKKGELAKGPIYIQNHHNPVQYRNIWLIKK